jgi:DNA-binding MarR family transcriptional regulator
MSEVDVSQDIAERQIELDPQTSSYAVVGAIAQSATQLLPRIDAELRARHGLSLPALGVLRLLSERAGERLTMSDLARVTGMSPAGITRVMQRLAAAGLVDRERDLADRRPLFASLTEAGEVRLEAAEPTYAHAVRAHLTAHAQPGELETVARFLNRALEAETGRRSA